MTRLRTASAIGFVLVAVSSGVHAAGESLSVNPTSTVGGKVVVVRLDVAAPKSVSTTYRVSLTGPVTQRELEIVLGANRTSVEFKVETTPVAQDTSVAMCASSHPPACDAELRFGVRAPRLEALAFSSTRVANGTPFQGTVSLDGPAPTGGFEVDLVQSPSPGSAQPTAGACPRFNGGALAPDSVLIPAGSSSKSFTIPTFHFTPGAEVNEVTSALAARAAGIEKTQTLTVQKLKFTTFTVQPSVGPRPLNVTIGFGLNGALPASRTVRAETSTVSPDRGEIALAPGQTSGSIQMTITNGKTPVKVYISAECADTPQPAEINLLGAL